MDAPNQNVYPSNIDLFSLFEEQKFEQIINIANENNISPSSDPNQSFVVAAALFKTDNSKNVCCGAKA